jgi:hypothetical protein
MTAASSSGEVSRDLPGSQSVARAEDVAWNLGDPVDPRRTHYGSQAGRPAQRRGELTLRKLGIRWVHNDSRQGPSGPEASEGANTSTPFAQETNAVRTMAPNWPTSLRTRASWGEELGAGKPLAGICAGGVGQPASHRDPRAGQGGETGDKSEIRGPIRERNPRPKGPNP